MVDNGNTQYSLSCCSDTVCGSGCSTYSLQQFACYYNAPYWSAGYQLDEYCGGAEAKELLAV